MVSSADIIRGFKVVGIIATMFFCEILTIFGVIAFFIGAAKDEPSISIFGFLIASVCGWLVRTLFDPLDEALR